jgi:hypothetical protein
MRNTLHRGVGLAALVLLALTLGGCPTDVTGLFSSSTEVVEGSTGESRIFADEPSVEVLTPVSDLSILGGTQVEVNWQAFAASRFTIINVIVDRDQDPGNGNETEVFSGLSLSETQVLVDTTNFRRGTYNIGVVLEDVGEIVASGYAPGQIIIDQRPDLYFTTNDARQSRAYDRTVFINPRIDIGFELVDPDSDNVVELYLDPNGTPDGNEILLFRSDTYAASSAAQAGSFSFDLPTASFEAGTYRILALIQDQNTDNQVSVYAPATIRLRGRIAGNVDLRDLDVRDGDLSGATFQGFNPRDNAGSFVSGAGDLDQDGFDDFIVVAQFGKPDYSTNLQRTGVGEVYIIYGRAQPFRGQVSLNSVGALFRGEILEGIPEQADPIRPSRGIASYTTLGDWDDDGIREMAFGLPFTDSRPVADAELMDNFGCFRTGGVVVVSSFNLRQDLGFPGGNVYQLGAIGQERFEQACPPVTPTCPMTFFGPNAPSPVDIGATLTYMNRYVFCGPVLPDPQSKLGARYLTHDFGDQCGESIDAYPFDGMLIAVPNRDPNVNTNVGVSVPGAGVVTLYFGEHMWNRADFQLPHFGPYRYIIDDKRVFDVSFAGNAIVEDASPGYFLDRGNDAPCERFTVHTRVVGQVSGWTPDSRSTMRIYGGFEGASISHVATLGDFNGDGNVDFTIGSPLSNDGAGACFIILARSPWLLLDSELPLEELGLPMNASDPLQQRVLNGVRVVGATGARLGQSQDSAGDMNGDGLGDVIIGSPLINNRQGGAAVFFGSRTIINLTEEEIPFDQLDDRGLGVIFVGEREGDLAGARVCGAGDVDGDGNDDILIAAPNRSVRMDVDLDGVVDIDREGCGAVYLIYGSPDLGGELSLADIGTEALPGVMFIGQASGDHLGAGLGAQGDRSVAIASAGDIDGDGRDDLLLGSVSAAPDDRAAAGEVYLILGAGD